MRRFMRNARITLSANGFTSVSCFINEPGIEVNSDGYGGWTVIDRPRNIGLVRFEGRQPLSLTIPILLDELDTNSSVESAITNLEALAGRGPRMGSDIEPPDVKITTANGFGALVPHNFDGENIPWVISGLELPADQAIRRGRQSDGSGGHRVRQGGTVTLLQHVKGTSQKSASRRKRHARRHTTHVVRKGETLMSIARDEYGDADKWRNIAVANKINDPRHLRVGAKLTLPSV